MYNSLNELPLFYRTVNRNVCIVTGEDRTLSRSNGVIIALLFHKKTRYSFQQSCNSLQNLSTFVLQTLWNRDGNIKLSRNVNRQTLVFPRSPMYIYHLYI